MTLPESDIAVHPKAHALTLFRVLPGGDAATYTAVTFPRDPWQGCEHTIRMARAVGWIKDPDAQSYAVLDVLDEAGDIIQDFSIPTSRAFQRLKRKLDLRRERGEE